MERRVFLSAICGTILTSLIPSRATTAMGAGASVEVSKKKSRYYQGPVTDHFNGERFFNPWEKGPTKTFFDFLKYRVNAERAVWPETFPIPHFDKPPERNDHNSYRVSYIGHASFLIQIAGLNILCDPVWSLRASPVSFAGPKRVNPPGIKFEDLPPIDIVLVSHNHYDHLDIPTLKRLHETFAPQFITPLGNGTIIKKDIPDANITIGDWYDHIDLKNVHIHFEPAHHWSARGMNDRREALWASFVIESADHKILFIGDTGFGDGHAARIIGERHKKIDLALIPIGAYEPRWFMSRYHVNPAEAVQIKKLTNSQKAIAHHWGTFQLTDEAITKPVEDLKIALADQRLKPEKFLTLRPGQAEILSA